MVVDLVAHMIAAAAVALGVVLRWARHQADSVSLVVAHVVNPRLLQVELLFRLVGDALLVDVVGNCLGSQVCHSHPDHGIDNSSVTNATGVCANILQSASRQCCVLELPHWCRPRSCSSSV